MKKEKKRRIRGSVQQCVDNSIRGMNSEELSPLSQRVAEAILSVSNDDDFKSVLITDPVLLAQIDQAEAERNEIIGRYRRGEISEAEEIAALDEIQNRLSDDYKKERSRREVKHRYKYIKCQKCGWVHFIEPTVDAPWECFHCGNMDVKTLVRAFKKEVPQGSTIQPINIAHQFDDMLIEDREGAKRLDDMENDTTITVPITLPIRIKKKGKLFVSSCPILDIHSQGKTFEEAKKNLSEVSEVMHFFITTCFKRGTLGAVLKECRHVGSNFDDFLKEEGTLKESEAVAIKRVEELRQVPLPTLGEILLEEFLKPLKISQARLAKETGIPRKHIKEIITGQRVIDLHDVKALGEFFKTGLEFWINLQAPIAQTSHADLRKKAKPMKTSSAKLNRKDRDER